MKLHEILEELNPQTSTIELMRVSWIDKKGNKELATKTIWCRYGSFYQGSGSDSDTYYMDAADILADDWRYAKKVWVPA